MGNTHRTGGSAVVVTPAAIARAEALANPQWERARPYLGRRNPRPSSEWQPVRHELIERYAFAVTEPEALAYVAAALGGRAVELGAGTGYWASLLAQLGVDMLAYDSAPTGDPRRWRNSYHLPAYRYFPVREGGPAALAAHADRTLLLCWPPLAEDAEPGELPMASAALAAYPGRRVVYIGEHAGGCTGDPAFFATLAAAWREVGFTVLPSWPNILDAITVYERR